jgi:hypothetical protein
MRPATFDDPPVEDSFAEHWLWTVSAVTPPIMMLALATSAELSTDIADPEPPWVLTLSVSKLRTPGMPTVASEPANGPPPPDGSVTDGVGDELTVSPWTVKLSCSPRALPASPTNLLVNVDELLAGLGSGSLAFTLAAFEMVPLLRAVTLIDTVAPAPEASVPSEQVTVPDESAQLPWLALADTNPTPAGNVSLVVTPVAGEDPALATESV